MLISLYLSFDDDDDDGDDGKFSKTAVGSKLNLNQGTLESPG